MLPPDTRSLDLEPYRRAIAACAPELASAPMTYLSDGWDNVAIDVDDRFIFRFPRREENARQLEIERLLLPELATTLPVRVPGVAFTGRDERMGWLFLGHHKIAGTPLSVAGLSAAQVDRLARQLGAFLTALHAFPQDEAERMGVPICTNARWAAHWRSRLEEAGGHVLPLLSAGEQDSLARLWERYFRSLEETPFQPVLIHHDLGVRHILTDPAMGEVTGIIDWGDAAVADPAFDLAGIVGEAGRPFMERVLAHYGGPADSALPFRAGFHAVTALVIVTRQGVRRQDQAWVRSAVADLKAALAARGERLGLDLG